MSNIIEFPSKLIRDWGIIEHGIIDMIQNAGLNNDVAKEVIVQIKPLFDILIAGIDFNVIAGDTVTAQSLDAINDSLAVALKEFGEKIFIERVKREIELCRLGGLS